MAHDQLLKNKKKLGKAEKIDEGEANFLDYPVHSEVESSSKFHILIKSGNSYKPYCRVVVMDIKRFDAFMERIINGVL
ncbi:hypothetical protein KIN20_015919 [Parelaphostrongylus tenuis]|uniref:Uncharacterized protein n=1 Tax=Parelaphostrongylus tenuis TaxID=148309 RepID=A0AAD5MKH8_PARTN|nr:hypothetical protein KIN20_015919 [Parelaphostrongylus tenuis]